MLVVHLLGQLIIYFPIFISYLSSVMESKVAYMEVPWKIAIQIVTSSRPIVSARRPSQVPSNPHSMKQRKAESIAQEHSVSKRFYLDFSELVVALDLISSK